MSVILIKIKKGDQETEYKRFTKKEIFIGRIKKNDLVLNNQNVSKRHCKLVIKPNGLKIHDLNSTNGTFVNGIRIKKYKKINPSDAVYIGDYTLEIKIQDLRDDNNHLQGSSQYFLKCVHGSVIGETFAIPEFGELTIGSSQNVDILLNDRKVSRRHAKLTIIDQYLTISDLTNYVTKVNDQEIKSFRELNLYDLIEFGATKLILLKKINEDQNDHQNDIYRSRKLTNDQLDEVMEKYGSRKLTTIDKYYFTIEKGFVEKVLEEKNADLAKYMTEIHDCDDYAFALKGVFSKPPLSKYLVGWARSSNHAYNFFIDYDFNVWLIEPQSNEIIFYEDIYKQTDPKYLQRYRITGFIV